MAEVVNLVRYTPMEQLPVDRAMVLVWPVECPQLALPGIWLEKENVFSTCCRFPYTRKEDTVFWAYMPGHEEPSIVSDDSK